MHLISSFLFCLPIHWWWKWSKRSVQEKCFCWHNLSHSVWLWQWGAKKLDKTESSSKICMRGVSTEQWPSLKRTLDECLCDAFVEIIEEIEVWKWDDTTRDFWSRLAKALQQSNISVTGAEQLDSWLASMHTTGKLSWAVATRSIRDCKIWIERIGGSRLDTDSEVWGLDQTTWELMWMGEAAMRKSIPALFPSCLEFSRVVERKH